MPTPLRSPSAEGGRRGGKAGEHHTAVMLNGEGGAAQSRGGEGRMHSNGTGGISWRFVSAADPIRQLAGAVPGAAPSAPRAAPAGLEPMRSQHQGHPQTPLQQQGHHQNTLPTAETPPNAPLTAGTPPQHPSDSRRVWRARPAFDSGGPREAARLLQRSVRTAWRGGLDPAISEVSAQNRSTAWAGRDVRISELQPQVPPTAARLSGALTPHGHSPPHPERPRVTAEKAAPHTRPELSAPLVPHRPQ